MTGAPILETSLQRAHEWLHDIQRELGFGSEHASYAALRATLHAVRDRSPVELVAHFGAGLPTMIRGIYYDGWHPSAARLREAHAESPKLCGASSTATASCKMSRRSPWR